MTDKDKKIILDFSQLQLTPEEFASQYSGDLSDKIGHIKNLLSECIKNKDGDAVEYSLMLARRMRLLNNDLVNLLSNILPEDWHNQHEDIASLFQDLKNADAIEALYKTALKKYDYLSYNDSSALARKCVWALSDINTPNSLDKLKSLANCDDETIRGYAQKRLQTK